MSLSALDIVALARAGFSAEQIGAINAESTQSTASTESTESTESTNLSTVQEPATPVQETNPTPAPEPAKPAPEPAKPAAAAPDQGPTMQDLMAKLAAMESRIHNNAILNDQQPGQQGTLTGQDVLARILDPTIE